jgi:hypothetical protein
MIVKQNKLENCMLHTTIFHPKNWKRDKYKGYMSRSTIILKKLDKVYVNKCELE